MQPLKPSPQHFRPIPDSSNSSNIWQRAENELTANPDTQQLLQPAYQALTAELGEELYPIRTSGRQGQLDGLFQRRAVAREKKNGVFSGEITGDCSGLGEQRIRKGTVKDLIDTAARANPPGALACAGLSVVFTLASSHCHEYQVMEDVHRADANAGHSPGHKSNLLRKFEDHLTDLYAEFQVRAMNNLGRRSVIRLLSDAFDIERWGGILQGIKGHESSTEKDAQMAKIDQRFRTIQSTQEFERARRIITERDKMARKLLRTLYI